MNLTNALAQALHLPRTEDGQPMGWSPSYLQGFEEARRLALIAADNFEPTRPLLIYGELTKDQQDKVLAEHYRQFLYLATGGLVTFDDPELTAGIARAVRKAEGLRTPWFTAEYIHDEVGDLLKQIVRSEVEEAFYINPAFEGAISPFNPGT